MSKNAIPGFAWFIPLAPLALAAIIYFGDLQSSSFLLINQFTQRLPDTLWAWLTFLGNGWGLFALAFPLLLLAPRILTAGIFAGAIAAVTSSVLKGIFNLPRPAGVLNEGSFYRIGEVLLQEVGDIDEVAAVGEITDEVPAADACVSTPIRHLLQDQNFGALVMSSDRGGASGRTPAHHHHHPSLPAASTSSTTTTPTA